MVKIGDFMGRLSIIVRRGEAEEVHPLPRDADDELIDVMLANIIRMERDKVLTGCDWTRADDCPLSDERRAAWATYRQAWRDVPQQVGFPREVNYPAAPGEGEADAD